MKVGLYVSEGSNEQPSKEKRTVVIERIQRMSDGCERTSERMSKRWVTERVDFVFFRCLKAGLCVCQSARLLRLFFLRLLAFAASMDLYGNS